MHRNNRRNQSLIRPWWIIGATGALSFIFLLSSYTSYHNYKQNEATINKFISKNNELKNKYTNIKPKKTIISRGGFDLTKHQSELDNTYSTLLKYAFGTAKNSKDLSTHSDLFIKYFGNDGYSKLKNMVLDSSNKANAVKNISTKITFSKFDVDSMSSIITAYTVFQLANKIKGKSQAIVYMSGTYDYEDHTGSDFNMQFSTVD